MRDQRGSASVVAVALLAVAAVTGVALAALAGHLADRAKARAGADLVAIAAAVAARERLDGSGPAPCEVAARVALANEVVLGTCTMYEDYSVQVLVKADAATAHARAGPGARWGSG